MKKSAKYFAEQEIKRKLEFLDVAIAAEFDWIADAEYQIKSVQEENAVCGTDMPTWQHERTIEIHSRELARLQIQRAEIEARKQ